MEHVVTGIVLVLWDSNFFFFYQRLFLLDLVVLPGCDLV